MSPARTRRAARAAALVGSLALALVPALPAQGPPSGEEWLGASTWETERPVRSKDARDLLGFQPLAMRRLTPIPPPDLPYRIRLVSDVVRGGRTKVDVYLIQLDVADLLDISPAGPSPIELTAVRVSKNLRARVDASGRWERRIDLRPALDQLDPARATWVLATARGRGKKKVSSAYFEIITSD